VAGRRPSSPHNPRILVGPCACALDGGKCTDNEQASQVARWDRNRSDAYRPATCHARVCSATLQRQPRGSWSAGSARTASPSRRSWGMRQHQKQDRFNDGNNGQVISDIPSKLERRRRMALFLQLGSAPPDGCQFLLWPYHQPVGRLLARVGAVSCRRNSVGAHVPLRLFVG
jgi:hypothetical protein